MSVKDVGEKCMLAKNLYVGEKPSPIHTSKCRDVGEYVRNFMLVISPT